MSPALSDGMRQRAQHIFRTLPMPVQRRILGRLDRHSPWDDHRPPTAPPAPAGMTTGPPDFVGIGVPKCGTSWWFSLLTAHPEIYVANSKELLYFNQNFLNHLNADGLTQAELDTYHDWFPRPEGRITGEWTPNYVFRYQLPPLLRRAAPGAKLLVMLRDPIERYQSDVSRHMNRRQLQNTRYKSVNNGYYSAILAPWEQDYGPSELLVLQFEACLADPGAMLDRTFEFLGVAPGFRPANMRVPVNKTRAKRDVDRDIETLLARAYERDVVELVARHPQIDLALWPNFAPILGRPPAVAESDEATPVPDPGA